MYQFCKLYFSKEFYHFISILNLLVQNHIIIVLACFHLKVCKVCGAVSVFIPDTGSFCSPHCLTSLTRGLSVVYCFKELTFGSICLFSTSLTSTFIFSFILLSLNLIYYYFLFYQYRSEIIDSQPSSFVISFKVTNFPLSDALSVFHVLMLHIHII